MHAAYFKPSRRFLDFNVLSDGVAFWHWRLSKCKFSVVSLVLWLLPSVCLFPGFYWRNSASADLVGRCTYMQYGHGELDTTLNFELFLIVSWRFKRKIITTFDNLLAEE